MYDDDEIAEGGEMHEHNGREYSVVGNDVYVKGLFGWKLVEDEDEQAEAGDHRERNHKTYSLVGDTVYRRNWLNGWDEVEDEEERAEAGDIEEVNNKDYSRVGNTIYRKDLFGWAKVEDTEEEAEAGDIREVNNKTYSLVGDTVYRKDLFGWVEVDDDDECAEAGDIYERNNSEYSCVGDTVYRKELFGWVKLTEDDDEYIGSGSSYTAGDSSDDYSDDYNYSDNYSSSSTGSSTSNGGSLTSSIIVIIIIVAVILYWLSSKSGNNQVAEQTPAYTNVQVAQPAQQAAQNPYGEGNGQVAFYRVCPFCKITVLLDTTALGNLPAPPLLVNPQCTDDYMLRVIASSGTRIFTIRDDEGYVWQDTVQVPNGDCVLAKIIKPDYATKMDAQQAATTTETAPESQPVINNFAITNPADHSSFDYPRYTQVEWTPVPQADSYEVEFQLADAPYDYTATSFSPMPYSNGGIYSATGTSVTVQGMGKQVHRLRVKALRNNNMIAQTEWRYITYNN